MHTIYFWQHTNPITGRRIRTRHRLDGAMVPAPDAFKRD